jgi:hypothetical protein
MDAYRDRDQILHRSERRNVPEAEPGHFSHFWRKAVITYKRTCGSFLTSSIA